MSEQTSEATDTLNLQVSKVVDHPVKSVWDALLTDDGSAALLGPGGHLSGKGSNWQAEDGTHGVTRSYHPMEQIRFTFHRNDEGPGSLVEVDLVPQGEKQTSIEITHSKLPAEADREWLTQHWEKALERIDADAL